jgi:uncharacterized protein (DUF1697 family)
VNEAQVSLLRGINVGRANRIGMADLRAVYVQLGCRDVATYVQSGNVILVSTDPPDELSRRVEIALEVEHGLKVRVLSRTHAQLAKVVTDDPYPAVLPTEYHVVFLSGPIPADRLAALSRFATGGETFTAIDQELHLMLPNGLGRSKLAQALTERHLGVVGTARNWRTVQQLHELSRAAPCSQR